ncbi:MAG: NifB/NifX family molybdenum-iron cluster-binding protein [Halanaeroarchaeum sp.]
MRVCVPTTDDVGLEAAKSNHFGRAPVYTIVDPETDAVETVENRSRPAGGSKMPPEFVADHGVDAVLVDHVGRRGMELFEELDIEVYHAPQQTVRDAVEAFRAGELEELEMADAHEHGGGHGHEHGGGHGHDHGDAHNQENGHHH